MILTLNIGNTHITMGGWQDDKLAFRAVISSEQARTADEYAVQLQNVWKLYGIAPAQFEGAVLSSVVPALTSRLKQAVTQLCGIQPLTVGPGLKSGLAIGIDNPAQLGAELVCAAVAALEKFTPPLVVMNADTAVTMMAIDANRRLLGGVIVPGPAVSVNALVRRTAQLSQVDLDAVPQTVIGTNSTASLQTGTVLGAACMLDGLIDHFAEALGCRPAVVFTGSMPQSVLQCCRTPLQAERDLILRGMYLIYRKNRRV